MSEPQICATYYAALTHDFEHLGVNNDYLIKSFHPLAVMYNDISPLENHHLAAAVRVMQRPECRYIKASSLPFDPCLSALQPLPLSPAGCWICSCLCAIMMFQNPSAVASRPPSLGPYLLLHLQCVFKVKCCYCEGRRIPPAILAVLKPVMWHAPLWLIFPAQSWNCTSCCSFEVLPHWANSNCS